MTSNASNPSQDTSIYTNDGTLTSARTVNQNNNNLSFMNGNVGIGSNNPANTLHIGAPAAASTTGIRTSITSASAATTETAYLAVNASGDIVRGAAIVSGARVWSALSGALSFGVQVGGVFEFTSTVNASGFVELKRNHSNNANTFKVMNEFRQHQTAYVCMAKDFTFPTAATVNIVSFDPNANKTLPNGAFWSCFINDFGGNRYRLTITSFGGGYASYAEQMN